MFAIVDIETTGLYNGANCITEIAVVLHNGHEIEGKYSSLVNPQMPIQKYVQGLTGITDEMVKSAPLFATLAPNIFNLLQNRVFVAHNVNFDYSIVKQALQESGYLLQTPKLCTIRLAKKIYPGLPKYGLASLAKSLNVPIRGHHRALGDAYATAEIFSLLVQNDTDGELKKMVKKKSEQYLPPLVDAEIIEKIPQKPGVYYFHSKQKVVYVGKAINLQKRIKSHFANNKASAKKQEMLRVVDNITYEECVNDFVASILESVEIKRLWPIFNKSQKHFEHKFGIYKFEDASGYQRLCIDKARRNISPLISFRLYAEAHSTLWSLTKKHALHPYLCFLDKSTKTPTDLPDKQTYNQLIGEVVEGLELEKQSFLVDAGKGFCILVENNMFVGMGVFNIQDKQLSINTIKSAIQLYPENSVAKSLIKKYLDKYPQKMVLVG